MIGLPKLIAAFTVAALIGGAAFAQMNSSHEASEQAVQLSQVPQAARDAAEKDLGAKVSEAKVMQQNGQQVYELETRTASGEQKSVQVSPDGKVLGHEAGDGDDDED
jgi:uncharacterized membrane protein YkoI